jgi:hypothetical protein
MNVKKVKKKIKGVIPKIDHASKGRKRKAGTCMDLN